MLALFVICLFAVSNLARAAMKSLTTVATLAAELQNEVVKVEAFLEALCPSPASVDMQVMCVSDL